MAADDMEAMERAWICAGWRSIVSEDWDEPEAFDAEGEEPVLMVPEAWCRKGWRDNAFGDGMAQVYYGRYGFLGLLRALIYFDHIPVALAGVGRNARDQRGYAAD